MKAKEPPALTEGRLLARARDKFFRENPELLEMSGLYGSRTPEVYLRNRLVTAFIAGWETAKKQEKK